MVFLQTENRPFISQILRRPRHPYPPAGRAKNDEWAMHRDASILGAMGRQLSWRRGPSVFRMLNAHRNHPGAPRKTGYSKTAVARYEGGGLQGRGGRAVRMMLAWGLSAAWVTLQLRVPKPASRVPELARAAVRGVFAGVWARSERTALVTASVASRIRCRRLRAAIGAQRKAQRAAHTELYWQAMQRRDALRWPAQTDR